MKKANSATSLAGLKWGDHLACLCDTAEERLEVLGSYIHEGLQRGQRVCCLLDKGNPEAVMDALSRLHEEPETCLTTGRLSFVRIDEFLGLGTFEPDSMFEWLELQERQALDNGCSGLRVTLEMSWVLRGLVRTADLLAFELKLTSFVEKRKCLILCQYERKRFTPASLLFVVTVHPRILHAKQVYDNCYFLAAPHLLEKDLPATTLGRWLKDLRSRQMTVPA